MENPLRLFIPPSIIGITINTPETKYSKKLQANTFKFINQVKQLISDLSAYMTDDLYVFIGKNDCLWLYFK